MGLRKTNVTLWIPFFVFSSIICPCRFVLFFFFQRSANVPLLFIESKAICSLQIKRNMSVHYVRWYAVNVVQPNQSLNKAREQQPKRLCSPSTGRVWQHSLRLRCCLFPALYSPLLNDSRCVVWPLDLNDDGPRIVSFFTSFRIYQLKAQNVYLCTSEPCTTAVWGGFIRLMRGLWHGTWELYRITFSFETAFVHYKTDSCIFGVALKHATETVTCRETSQYCVVYVRDAHKDVCAKTGKIRRADFYRGSNRYIKDGDVNDVITRLRTEWITAIGKKDSYGNRVRLGQERGSSRREAIIIAANDDSPRKSTYYLLLHFMQRHRFY